VMYAGNKCNGHGFNGLTLDLATIPCDLCD
jgi:hypothetical protein